ncbi:MAG: T9SS type A sorting domain-containing protein [Saprospiraceae bacterium]|nr:T9SS type A sorting domain-containing protein [Saprospiraceae bacterium]
MKTLNIPHLSHRFLICLVLASGSLTFGYSQTWLANGHAWHYEVSGGWNPATNGAHIEVVEGDTLVRGIACKRIVHYSPNSTSWPIYAYAENGRVFVNHDQDFIKIYDFNLNVGDTVFLLGSRRYVIDSVGTILIGGSPRRFQSVQLTGSQFDSGSYFVPEGIGLVPLPDVHDISCAYFFLLYAFCDSPVDGWDIRFGCFTTTDVIVYNPYDYCAETTATTAIPLSNALRIYPNPVQAEFTIAGQAELTGPGQLTVLDAAGRECLRLSVSEVSLPVTVSTQQLQNGSYIVLLAGREATVRGRLIVQREK